MIFPISFALAGTLKYQSALDEFYKGQGGDPLWVNGEELNPSGEALLGVLKQSWQSGLNPETYHVPLIIVSQSAIERELLLSDAYVRYVIDLSGMRVNARVIGLNPDHWRQPINASEALSYIPANKGDIASFLQSREPQTRTYQRLKLELTDYAQDHEYSDEINQITVNMERLRWVEDEKPKRFVVVNIPSATLWAVDDGDVVLEMPVIIGRQSRPTQSFVTKIHGVRFNPTWTVPPTIKLKDILPQLQLDPSYLSDKAIELYDGYGSDSLTLDPLVINWSDIGTAELNNLRMVQIPGRHNPLGDIRILMPNDYNIYLHDTNNKELFSHLDRAKSSGCVRMKYPKKMAKFILGKSNNSSEDVINNTINKGETTDIYISERIAVYLLYYTVWLGNNNQIIYGFDLYNNDKTLLQLLEKLD